MPQIALVHTTFPSHTIAVEVSKLVLNARLAACANLHTVESFYNWEGRQVEEEEIAVDYKTSISSADKLLDFLKLEHPNEVPCFLIQRVETTESYCEWVESSTSGI